MFDIKFMERTHKIKRDLIENRKNSKYATQLYRLFEGYRDPKPKIFNIETTNHCNLECVMCPRTTELNRKLMHMDPSLYAKIAEAIEPHSQRALLQWKSFVEKEFKLNPKEKGENNFYFFISSTAVTLHGLGEPLLDPKISDRVRILTNKGTPTYFSCNPSNIQFQQIQGLFNAGLTYLKFSVDSLDDQTHKFYRGEKSNFSKSCNKILKVLEMKEKSRSQTTIVLTMIRFNKDQKKEEEVFLKFWEKYDVYAYIKSQNVRWLYEEENSAEDLSHYMEQYCEFPWTSMTILVDGTVVPCTQDYNGELAMGNVQEHSLEEIWNSKKYKEFRQKHITGNFSNDFFCNKKCDIPLLFEYTKDQR